MTVTDPRPSPLARYLLLAYVLLVIYASLHPFSGWRDQGVGAFAFFTGGLPRYITTFDLVTNFAAYLPLGFLVLLALHPHLRGTLALTTAGLAGCLLSFALETLQTFLPSRFPSNLDFATNALGAFAGAALALRFGISLLGSGRIYALRHRWFAAGARYDLGLVLLALWLFTQLTPETLLFGNGDLRGVLGPAPAVLHSAEVFIQAEAAVAACNLLAIGLFLSCLMQDARPLRRLLLALFAAALALKTVAVGVVLKAQNVLAWLTPGAFLGLAGGALTLLLAVALPRAARLALAGLLLMAATVLVNLTPENPYLVNALKQWPQGYFLNFNGVTHLVSLAWPFVALFYLMLLAPRLAAQGSPSRDKL
ncbi:MAG: VanZ family protein [Betaproteobacteria bacterium]|nr:MAG: VanZ family protein [Betaproteobacteria bacterium]